MNSRHFLFLHGALYESSIFTPIRESLPEGTSSHTFDFPGHGSSPFPEGSFSIELFGTATIEEMDRLGIDRASIFGYSMGGYVGLWLARHYPEKVDRVMTLGTKMDWNPEGAAREKKLLDPEAIDQKVPQFGETLRQRHGQERWREVLVRTGVMMENLGNDPELKEDDLRRIEQPVRMMVGDRDRMVTIEETVAAFRTLPNGQLAVLPGTGHPLERLEPQVAVDQITRFLFPRTSA